MLSWLVQQLQRLPTIRSLVKVDHFFVLDSKDSVGFALENNYVFQHACKTPLTVLECSLQLLDEQTGGRESKNVIASASTAVERLKVLINSVTSKDQEQNVFSVASAINEVIVLSRQKDTSTISLNLIGVEDLKIRGRRIYFQEMLVCMINNAIEAYQNTEKPHITVTAQRKGGILHIHVIDFASGMSLVAQKMACLQGVSYKKRGMGLGLYFVKKTIEVEFFGNLHIHSKLGMGTHVHITMPVG